MTLLWYTLAVICTSILLIAGIASTQLVLHKKVRFDRFAYSSRNYYLLLTPLVIPLVLLWVYTGDLFTPAVFVLCAVGGMLGEVLFSIYWNTIFTTKFWEYKVRTLYHAYSSTLNAIPWGIGGLLYLELATIANFTPPPQKIVFFGSVLLCTVFLTTIYTTMWKKRHHTVTLTTYAYAMIPFITALIATSIAYADTTILRVALLFGSVAMVAEYIFGKLSSRCISKKLWVYTHMTYDHGHITPLSFLPFSLAGFWFIALATLAEWTRSLML